MGARKSSSSTSNHVPKSLIFIYPWNHELLYEIWVQIIIHTHTLEGKPSRPPLLLRDIHVPGPSKYLTRNPTKWTIGLMANRYLSKKGVGIRVEVCLVDQKQTDCQLFLQQRRAYLGSAENCNSGLKRWQAMCKSPTWQGKEKVSIERKGKLAGLE